MFNHAFRNPFRGSLCLQNDRIDLQSDRHGEIYPSGFASLAWKRQLCHHSLRRFSAQFGFLGVSRKSGVVSKLFWRSCTYCLISKISNLIYGHLIIFENLSQPIKSFILHFYSAHFISVIYFGSKELCANLIQKNIIKHGQSKFQWSILRFKEKAKAKINESHNFVPIFSWDLARRVAMRANEDIALAEEHSGKKNWSFFVYAIEEQFYSSCLSLGCFFELSRTCSGDGLYCMASGHEIGTH